MGDATWIDWTALILLLSGAIGSTWFFFDYLRTADLKSSYARMTLLLNGSLGTLLWMSTIRRFTEFSLWHIILGLSVFAVVDIAIVLQIFMLHKARKAQDKLRERD